MPNKKISQLPLAGTLTGSEKIILTQSGDSVSSTLTQVIALVVDTPYVHLSGDTMTGTLVAPNVTATTLSTTVLINGVNNVVVGPYGHAEGNSSQASGQFSHAEGYHTTASGDFSHAEGDSTIASGNTAHAEGDSSQANGDDSHAEGYFTQSNGYASHSEGDNSIASGYASHAEGTSTLASGSESHSEGHSTQAIGEDSHAEGLSTVASGFISHAEGDSSVAVGVSSHAEGYGTQAIGYASHSSGIGTVATASGQTAMGKFNTDGNTTSLFVIGNGTDSNNKSDLALFNMTGVTINGVFSATTFRGDGSQLTGISGGTFGKDVYVTGGTYSNPLGTATFTNSTGGTFSVAGFTTGGTSVTAYTWTAAQNKATISQSGGLTDLSIFITSMSGLTLSNLTADRLVYTTTGGALITGTAIFDGTNMQLPAAGSLTVGTGGVTIGSGGSPSVAGTGDLVVNGNLTVFGAAISAFTAQLYVEDPNVIFNYNPTGSTIATSIGAGLTIQDGNGIVGGNVSFDVRAMNTFTGLTATQVPVITEYTGATGFSTRAWVTPLNDIVLRSTVPSTPNGVRVLAEFDLLDGGSY